MRVTRSPKGNLPYLASNLLDRKKSASVAFTEVFEGKVRSSLNATIDELRKEVSELTERVEKNFREDYVSSYRELIKKLVLKTLEVVKVIEKTSEKSRNRVLKVVVVADEKLKRVLEEIITSEVSKIKVKEVLRELEGILISLRV